MKEAAYKGLVRPVLEYGCSVWDPHTHGLHEELEKVQYRAARFVTGNLYLYSDSDRIQFWHLQLRCVRYEIMFLKLGA